MKPYNKPVLTSEEHLSLLEKRGLIVNNPSRALKYLETIGYYRLSGYMYSLQKPGVDHLFRNGTTFNDVMLHYQFDKRLRALFLEYIERVEVALRAKLTNVYSLKYGFHWYRKKELFHDGRVYKYINASIDKSFRDEQDRFVKVFKRNYSDKSLPSNMAMETLTFGSLSRLFAGLKKSDEKKQIATDFGIPLIFLESWFSSVTITRNICAHHSRLWNLSSSVNQPIIPKKKDVKFNGKLPIGFQNRTYGRIAILERLLRTINPTNSFIDHFVHLHREFPLVNLMHMGFPESWVSEAAWSKNT